jgi:hypothetical protein
MNVNVDIVCMRSVGNQATNAPPHKVVVISLPVLVARIFRFVSGGHLSDDGVLVTSA